MFTSTMATVENITSIINATASPSVAVETTTLLSNLTTTILTNIANITNDSTSSIITSGNELGNHSTGILQQSMIPEDEVIHKNPELKYFSTVIIIFIGLTILIVPVFCFVGVLCARARLFKTVREAAGRGWGFSDVDVPYAEFGADDYAKDKPESAAASSSRDCDVKILVAADNCVAETSRSRASFLRIHSDEDEDISSLPPTFVHNPSS